MSAIQDTMRMQSFRLTTLFSKSTDDDDNYDERTSVLARASLRQTQEIYERDGCKGVASAQALATPYPSLPLRIFIVAWKSILSRFAHNAKQHKFSDANITWYPQLDWGYEIQQRPGGKILFLRTDSYTGWIPENIIWQTGGEVRLTYEDGTSFEGYIVNFEATGQGMWKFPDGTVYRGNFKKGKPHGYGITRYSDGYQYQGHYVYGCRQGKGQFLDPSGRTIFDGEFYNELPDGEGIFDCNGIKLNANFFEGEFYGPVQIAFQCGIKYRGELHTHQILRGELTAADGTVRNIEFENTDS